MATKTETNGSKVHYDEESGLHRSATAVTMSPELFEKVRFQSKFTRPRPMRTRSGSSHAKLHSST